MVKQIILNKLHIRNITIYTILILLILYSFLPVISSTATQVGSSTIEGQPRAQTLEWPMFGRNEQHTGVGISTPKGIFKGAEKWDNWPDVYGNGMDSWGTAIGNFVDNIAGTYNKNIEHVVYAEHGVVYIIDGEDGSHMWELDADLLDGVADSTVVYTTPALGYLNNNNQLDIVFGTDDGGIYVYEPKITYDTQTGYTWNTNNVNTEVYWSYTTNGSFNHSSPVLSDLNGDTRPDVVVTSDHHIIALDVYNKQSLWVKDIDTDMISSPAIYKDVGENRVVVTGFKETEFNFSIYMYSASGVTLNVIPIELGILLYLPAILPTPAVAELDGNTNNGQEIVILVPFEDNVNGKVHLLNVDGSEVWATAPGAILGQFDASPAVADLDADGQKEIVASSWEMIGLPPTNYVQTRIYAIAGKNGSVVWQLAKNTVSSISLDILDERQIASPVIGDVNNDGDGSLDIIVATTPSVYAVDGNNGTELWEYELGESNRVLWSSPAIGDIDNDDFLDVTLEALALSHEIIDLTLDTSDILFSLENITENQPVDIEAIVHNIGNAPAANVIVSFFDDDVLIDNITKSEIPGSDSRQARISWTPTRPGQHTIKVVLDPLNEIEEIEENNNEATKITNVIDAFPDFELQELKFYRGDGQEVDNLNKHLIEGEDSTLTVIGMNIGSDEAENVPVAFYDGNSQIGTKQIITKVEIDSEFNVSIIWKANVNPAEHNIRVKIDPDLNFQEENESNNELSKLVTIKPKQVSSNISFIVEGTVYHPDAVTLAIGAKVNITNLRTDEQLITTTDSVGHFSHDLKRLPSGYYEGEHIQVFVIDADDLNETSVSFIAYSDDERWDENIILENVPKYGFEIEIEDDAQEIPPGEPAEYTVKVTNRGNTANSINMSVSDVIDISTGVKAQGWKAQLNDYYIDDLPTGASTSSIILTVTPPKDLADAYANQQVRVIVNGESVDDPKMKDSATTTTTLKEHYELSLTVTNTNQKLNPTVGLKTNFSVEMVNNGNVDDTVELRVVGLPSGWISSVKASVSVPIGKTVLENLRVTVSQYSQAKVYTFTLNATSKDGVTSQTQQLRIEIVRPDLSISSLDINPSVPKVGEVVSITTIIENNGTATAANISVGFKEVNYGTDLKGDDISELIPQGFTYATSTWIPESAGDYLLEISVDENNFIIESDETNNVMYKTIKLYPDLKIVDEGISFSNNIPTEGTTITIFVTIENVGSLDIDTNFYIEAYRGKPGFIGSTGSNTSGSSSGTVIGSVEVTKSVGLGREYAFEIEWKTKTGSGIAAEIYVVIDSGDDITELDEDNNYDYAELTINKDIDYGEDGMDLTWLIVIGVMILILVIGYLFVLPKLDKDKGLGKMLNGLLPGGASTKSKPAPKKGKKDEGDEGKGKKTVSKEQTIKPKAKTSSGYKVVKVLGDEGEKEIRPEPDDEPEEVEVEEVEEEEESTIEVEPIEAEVEEYDDEIKPKRPKNEVDYASIGLIGLR
jgi:uncharacterized repeat protein (TIGR01451 family)